MSNAFSLLLAHPQASLLLGPTAVMRAMLSMERELVLAQADLGLVSREHAQTVASCCAWDHQDELQVDAWVAQAASAGSLAIPLVNALKARVRERDPQALAAVHLGATSQDLIDTALSVQGRQVLTLIDEAVQRVLRALIHLKQAHGQAPCGVV